MSSTLLYVNEKLNGLVLMKEGPWKYVNGRQKTPATSSKSEDSAELDKWETDGENAFATLCLAIADSEMSHVEECTTAAEVWEKFERVYETKSLNREMYIRKKLTNFKLEEGDTIQQHINKLNEI